MFPEQWVDDTDDEAAKLVVGEMTEACSHTPDAYRLGLSQFRLFFFFDSRMTKRRNYRDIEEHSAFLCHGFSGSSYVLRTHAIDGRGLALRPEVSPSPYGYERQPRGKIFGELHAVEATHVPFLDKLYENGVQFNRKRLNIFVPYRKLLDKNVSIDGRELPRQLQGEKNLGAECVERRYMIEAHMYLPVKEYWDPLLDGGYLFPRAKLYKPINDKAWLSKYYHYRE